MDINFLTEEIAVFTETSGGLLSVRVMDEEHPVVYLHSSFPHTRQNEYISVRTFDNEEVGMIRSLSDFSSEVVELLQKHIGFRYFAPHITRIQEIKEEFGYSFWKAETSAGVCRFTVGRGQNIRFVTAEKLLITDIDGNRFIIEDVGKLADKEYRMIEMYL